VLIPGIGGRLGRSVWLGHDAAGVCRCWVYVNHDTDAFTSGNASALRRFLAER
jgi:hypothetical protein